MTKCGSNHQLSSFRYCSRREFKDARIARASCFPTMAGRRLNYLENSACNCSYVLLSIPIVSAVLFSISRRIAIRQWQRENSIGGLLEIPCSFRHRLSFALRSAFVFLSLLRFNFALVTPLSTCSLCIEQQVDDNCRDSVPLTLRLYWPQSNRRYAQIILNIIIYMYF